MQGSGEGRDLGVGVWKGKRVRGGGGETKEVPDPLLTLYKEDSAAFSAAFSRGQSQLLLPPPPFGPGQWNLTRGSLVDTWWGGGVSNYSLGDQFMAPFFSVLPDAESASVLKYLSGGADKGSGLEGPFGIRALFPYLPHATDPWGGEYPPGVYANGGSYAWLTCGASLALLWGGEVSAAHRIWGALSQKMLFGGRGMPRVAYEYLHSDTGEPMGNAPQGWDGVCGAWAWLGGGVGWWRESPVWAWPPGGKDKREGREKLNLDAPYRLKEPGVWHSHTYHLTLPSHDLQPLTLPLTSLFSNFSEEGGSGGTAYFFLFDSETRKGEVVYGLKAALSGGGFSWAASFPCGDFPKAPGARASCSVLVKGGEKKEVIVILN